MKQQFTGLDVTVMVAILRRQLLGMRVANIYDIDKKTYVLKMARKEQKLSLLIESGVRMHITEFDREKSNAPSNFTAKLRKHIRTKRLDDLHQLGSDRVVVLSFGAGEQQNHLIVELYNQGNVILTDNKYEMLQLLRTRTQEDNTVRWAAHEVYPVEAARRRDGVSDEELLAALGPDAKADNLRNVLLNITDFGRELVDHCIMLANLNTSQTCGANSVFAQENSPELRALAHALRQGQKILAGAAEEPEKVKGYIMTRAPAQPGANKQQKKKGKGDADGGDSPAEGGRKSRKSLKASQKDGAAAVDGAGVGSPEPAAPAAAAAAAAGGGGDEAGPSEGAGAAPTEKDGVLYVECTPFLFLQHENQPYKEFDTFDQAVDEFFSKQEEKKLVVKKAQEEKVVLSKLDKIRIDQEGRVAALAAAQETNKLKAKLIEDHTAEVEEAILIIRSAIANGVDWRELSRIVKEEQRMGDPIARLIKDLKLDQNMITITLPNEVEAGGPQNVDLDLSMSAYANARRYYDIKKKSAIKHQKTVQATEKVLEQAEKSTRQQLKDVKVVQAGIQKMRKIFWFEKFNWFLSSDGIIVISGRDAHQNEQLVKRYLRPGDIYVHADIHGAASCVIKNPIPAQPIPPSTVEQAGAACVCRSAAWDAKIVTSAWWVYDHQVSKTAPSGEYLSTGSFMIRGKKNFLPPNPLIMGFGLLFRIDETCLAKHVALRAAAAAARLVEDSAPPTPVAAAQPAQQGKQSRKDKREGGLSSAVEALSLNDVDPALTTATATSTVSDKPPLSVTIPRRDADERKSKEKGKKQAASAAPSESESKPSAAAVGKGKAEAPADAEADAEGEASESAAYDTGNERTGGADDEDDEDEEEGESEGESEGEEKEDNVDDDGVVWPETPISVSTISNVFSPRGASSPRSVAATDRYAYDEPTQADETASVTDAGTVESQKKRQYVTAAQRRRLKKGLDPNAQPDPTTRPKAAAKKEPVPQQVRGKKKKLEKMKEKYGDQDEEEKSLKMKLLASSGKAAEPVAEPKPETRAEAEPEDEKEKNCYNCGKPGHMASNCPEPKAAPARKERRAAEKEERETLQQLLDEEGITDEDMTKMDEITLLTGTPMPDDIVTAMIPICAPYPTLRDFKYKVKLIPGPLKKGKAAKNAFHSFASQPDCTNAERDLIKAVKDQDMVGQILGNVTVSTGGSDARKRGGGKGGKGGKGKGGKGGKGKGNNNKDGKGKIPIDD